MPLELLNLSAERLAHLPPKKTVFFFPVAAPEDHGPHLPLGLKIFEARKLCELTAIRLESELPGWTGVLMPDAPLGVDPVTTERTVHVRAHVLRDWLLDSARSLMQQGFVHFACFSGQLTPKQLTTIEEAGRMLLRGRAWLPSSLARKGHASATLVSVSSALITPATVWHSPLWADPLEHGGAHDTSVALHLVPQAVSLDYAQLPSKVNAGNFFQKILRRLRRKTAGYWGTPADAKPETGKRALDQTVSDVFPKLRAVWEGSNPNHLFRSWYSVIPPNRSFFRIWILAFVLLLILWSWMLLTPLPSA